MTSFPSARFIPHAARALLVVTLAAACTTAPGSSPSAPPPTGSTGSPLPTGTPPSPTVPPTATPLPSPTFGAEQISHPTGATDVVLQMGMGAGMMLDFNLTLTPSFSLYGDGTLIYRPTDDPERPPGGALGLPRLLQAQLTEEQTQELLRVALGQGRLLDAREQYPQMTCADCGSVIFKFDAAGVSKTVTVDALSEVEPAGPDAVDRQAFYGLSQTLNGFEQRGRAGELGEITIYDPPMYRVMLMDAGQGGGRGQAGEWPWPDLGVDDFAADENGFIRTSLLSRDLVSGVTDVPSGGVASIVVEAPNDTLWSVAIRPLLPDELPEDPS